MAQTTEIFPLARKIYKKIFKSKKLNASVHLILELFVNVWSRVKGFYFPSKFNWEWKWEMLSRRFEQDTVELFKKVIEPGMTIFDIGAHVGYYTTFFSKLTGSTGVVYAFEPDPDNFELLKKNNDKNKNTKLFNLAIADKHGTIDFYKIKNNTSCHSIIPADSATKISVPSTTIDQFVSTNKISHIDIIKIDIEGGESAAFKGMENLFSRATNLIIIAEFNPDAIKLAGIDPREFLKHLEILHFQIYQILPGGNLKPLKTDEIAELKYYDTGFANLMFKK